MRIFRGIFVFLIFAGIICGSCFPDTKECEFCGSFYPGDKESLDRQLEKFFKQANPAETNGEIIGIISPHAGYVYSGPVAAYGYKTLKEADTVVIMAPSHKYDFNGVAVYPQGFFNVPSGSLQIDDDAVKQIQTLGFIRPDPVYFNNEHSVEVQLPFILKTFGSKVKIVPIVFSRVTVTQLEQLADTLVDISSRKKIIVIASSDLSHYLPYDKAVAVDRDTIGLIQNESYSALIDSANSGQGRACGIYPITTFLMYAQKKNADIGILKYANSGDTSGDKRGVVGYVSAVAVVPKKSLKLILKNNHGEAKMGEYTLTGDEKKILLKIARDTLQDYLKNKKRPNLAEPRQEALKALRGAFVTLQKHGELRGCIGRIVGDTPVYKVISEFAIHAALDDNRFSPVTYEELKDIDIEISVLTPFEKVKSLDEIEVGKHGLMIQNGWYSGLLLPQVPVEWGWDKKAFLENTCLKAGLPPGAYKDASSTLYKFSAIVFSEKQAGEDKSR